MTISKSGLQSGSPLELLNFSWLLNQQKLQDEFQKVQVEIKSENDLIAIAELSKNKLDITGAVKDENDNPVMFDTIRILKNIKYTEEEKESAKFFKYSE